MRNHTRLLSLPLSKATLLLSPAVSAVTIDWVAVGAPGNTAVTEVSFRHSLVSSNCRS